MKKKTQQKWRGQLRETSFHFDLLSCCKTKPITDDDFLTLSSVKPKFKLDLVSSQQKCYVNKMIVMSHQHWNDQQK